MGRKKSAKTRLARPKNDWADSKNGPKWDQSTVLFLYSHMGCFMRFEGFFNMKNRNKICTKKQYECKTKNMYAKQKKYVCKTAIEYVYKTKKKMQNVTFMPS
jgi:hypothetical protein